MRVLLLLPLAACIEGPERDSVYNIVPRVCETGIASDQTFVIDGRYGLDRQQRLVTNPPRFVLETPSGPIELDTTVGDFGVMTLVPRGPIPSDADVTLTLVEPGALDDAYIPPLFPAHYSTRSAAAIRSHRAVDGHMFVSFNQPLDAATVEGAVHVQRGTTPIAATVQYLDAPGHVVHVQVADQAPLDVVFLTSLRTQTGAAIFDTNGRIQIDPSYTAPPTNGCELAE